jgi:hypothetical protein
MIDISVGGGKGVFLGDFNIIKNEINNYSP